MRLLAAALILAAVPASAQSPYQVATSWGLFGTWVFDCAAPYADDNAAYTYVWRNNQVVLDRDYGDNKRDSNSITSLRSSRPDQIEYIVSFATVDQPQSRHHIWQKDPDGRRMRLLMNRNVATGEMVIADGHFSDGTPSSWTYRCR